VKLIDDGNTALNKYPILMSHDSATGYMGSTDFVTKWVKT